MAKPVKKLRLRKAGSKIETKPDHLGPTERRWMTHKGQGQMFDVLTVMSENNNRAFDILMLFFEKGADPLFHEMTIKLDDMNIRGDQIVLAFDYADAPNGAGKTTIDRLVNLIETSSQHMVDYINRNWKKAFMEQAVISGAHKWMHKKIVTPPNA